MVTGSRELIAGVHTDAQFGRCVMVGIGGVLTEALADVAFRLGAARPASTPPTCSTSCAPRRCSARCGASRRSTATRCATSCSRLAHLAADEPDVRSVDVNPLVIVDGRPIAVDALVVQRVNPLDPLFEPHGIIVAGASAHPGKFGFVTLHNILSLRLPGPGLPREPRGR